MIESWNDWAIPQLIQVTMLIVFVAVANRFWKQTRPHLMHALWVLVLVKAITPPVMSSPGGIFCWLRPSEHAAVSIRSKEAPRRHRSFEESLGSPRVEVHAPARSAESASDVIETPKPNPSAKTKPIVVPFKLSNNNTLQSQQPPAPTPEPVPTAREKISLGEIVFAVWFGSALLYLGFTLYRVRQTVRVARRHQVTPQADWQAAFEASRKLVGNSPRVNLIATTADVGPAVVGVIRPRVIVPVALLKNSSPETWKTIFAHELIHLHRGDLWLGWLQAMAQSLWWFHPLVHFAARQFVQAAERTCDERVIAELQCSPARYARDLLHVVEQHTNAHTVAPFPGIRSTELTTSRLERIMKLRHGCQKRTPWWCWIVMIVGGLFVLPGGAFVASSADASLQEKQEKTLPSPYYFQDDKHFFPRKQAGEAKLQQKATQDEAKVPARYAAPNPVQVITDREIREWKLKDPNNPLLPIATDEGEPTVTVNYDITAIIAKMQKDYPEATEFEAYRTVKSWINATAAQSEIKWTDQKHVEITATEFMQERIGSEINAMEQFGLKQVVLTIRFVAAPQEKIKEATRGWPLLLPKTDPSETFSGEQVLAAPAREQNVINSRQADEQGVESFVEKHYAMRKQVFQEDDMDWLSEFLGDAKSNIMMAPKVAILNGRTASIMDGSQRPFVIGVEPIRKDDQVAYQPIIRVINEGIANQVRAEVLEDNRIWVDSRIHVSEILGVEDSNYPGKGDDQGYSLQIPEVSHTIATASALIPDKGSLAISGIKRTVERRVETTRFGGLVKNVAIGEVEEELIVVITAQYVDPFNSPDSPKTERSATIESTRRR